MVVLVEKKEEEKKVVVVVVEVVVVVVVVVTIKQTIRPSDNNGVGRCQQVCVCVCVGGGGGGGAHRHIIYVPSVKNQYKRVVFGCMVIY